MAGDARTLQERLGTDPDAVERDDDVAAELDELLAAWRENVADGDPERFRTRLEMEGLDEAECRRRLATTGWPDDEPLPEWVHRLEDVVEFVVENPSADAGLDADREIPFEDVLAPFLAYARRQVDVEPSARFPEAAMADLVEWLANRVTNLWHRALFIEFKTHVADRDPDLVFDDDVEIPEGSTQYYDEFAAGMLEADRLTSFFLEYSFLGRLLASILHQWTARVEEFHAHVTEDWPDVRETFADGEDPGAITGIGFYGDHHEDGRTVFRVTFDSGLTVAYKPRNAGIAVGFYELVEWINERGDLPALRTLDFVYRDDHAWMEWVRPAECATREAVEGYYRRAGMLMCLFYALAATDMHLENIIAEGEQPVTVDLETVTEPVAKPATRKINETVKVVADTVVRTGVVPRHVPSNEVGDMAGFSVQRGSVDMEAQQFTNVNTDRMDLEMVEVPDREGANLPEHDGRVVGPREHADAIVDGFEGMYRFVLRNEEALLADDGPIAGLTDRETRMRVVYRPTVIYSRITEAMQSVSYLRTGLRFGVKAEVLAKLVVSHDVDPAVWSLFEAERSVLGRFNTPRFTAEMRSTDVFARGEPVVEEFFVQEPIEQVRERIRGFDEEDLDEQRDYLRWGYDGYEATHTGGEATRIPDDGADRRDLERVVEEHAREIFDRIEADARTEDGHPTWIRREVGTDGGIHVHPITDRLYDGRVGIGLFAAGLGRVLGDGRYGERARETVAPILEAVREGRFENDPESIQNPPRPVGGAVGLGSIVYGLATMGTLLDDDEYVRAATHVSELIDEDRLAVDDRYDVMQGSAGAILGLLALHGTTGDDDVLARARTAGDHLLANATDRDGALTWEPPGGGRPLCGFSHGVAGIALSLHRLADATGESRFGSAARDALAYERRQYDEAARNWPDLRAATDGRWMDAWCHGRTGVGLARLGAYEVTPSDDLRRDAERALRGVDPSAMTADDHVCCGNFGRVEFLVRAGRTLDEQSHVRDAELLASACARRAADAGQFSTQWATDHWYNPTFFGGEAGIGYGLLRLVDPSLPSVLLWE